MMGYDYELIFRKGSKNAVVDALSKVPQVALQAITMCFNKLLKKIKHIWLKDASMVHLIHKTQKQTALEGKYSWNVGQLRRRKKMVVGVDAGLRKDLLKYFHYSLEGGHSRMDTTLKRISTVVYWKVSK